MMLDRYSINRFSIGYCPLFAILAADGIARLTRAWPGAEPLVGGALIASFFVWTLPALATVRNTVAPSVLAVESVRQHLDPRADQLFVARDMDPFFQYLLPNDPFVHVFDEHALPLSADGRRAWILAEASVTDRDGFVFHRERGHLWNIARRHYFDAGLIPVRAQAQFVSGWYAPERKGPIELRPMSGNSTTVLPPSSGATTLHLELRFPAALLAMHPSVGIAFNGQLLDHFIASAEDEDREYHVTPAPHAGPNRLDLSTNQTIRKPGDQRELGMSVKSLSFGSE
jgi:hypothetical protein